MRCQLSRLRHRRRCHGMIRPAFAGFTIICALLAIGCRNEIKRDVASHTSLWGSPNIAAHGRHWFDFFAVSASRDSEAEEDRFALRNRAAAALRLRIGLSPTRQFGRSPIVRSCRIGFLVNAEKLCENISPRRALEYFTRRRWPSKWQSLDGKRICLLCERVITGPQIEIWHDHRGQYLRKCPRTDAPQSRRIGFIWAMQLRPRRTFCTTAKTAESYPSRAVQ
jgi:hypothetical protein